MAKQTALASAVKKPATPDQWVKEKTKDESSKLVKLVVEIPEDMHTQIKIKCAQQRTTIKEVTGKLFQKWLSGDVQP